MFSANANNVYTMLNYIIIILLYYDIIYNFHRIKQSFMFENIVKTFFLVILNMQNPVYEFITDV